MLLELLVVILPDNVLVTLDTQELHVINVIHPITVQVVFVKVSNSSNCLSNMTMMVVFSL